MCLPACQTWDGCLDIPVLFMVHSVMELLQFSLKAQLHILMRVREQVKVDFCSTSMYSLVKFLEIHICSD